MAVTNPKLKSFTLHVRPPPKLRHLSLQVKAATADALAQSFDPLSEGATTVIVLD